MTSLAIALLSVIGTLIILLLGWLLKMTSDLKKDVKEQINCIKEALAEKEDKENNRQAHGILHRKLENHYHNEKGDFSLRPHAITGG